MNILPAPDRRIPAHMKSAAFILQTDFPAVTCPACGHKTRGRLYLAGGVKICAGCAVEREKISGKTFKRAR